MTSDLYSDYLNRYVDICEEEKNCEDPEPIPGKDALERFLNVAQEFCTYFNDQKFKVAMGFGGVKKDWGASLNLVYRREGLRISIDVFEHSDNLDVYVIKEMGTCVHYNSHMNVVNELLERLLDG